MMTKKTVGLTLMVLMAFLWANVPAVNAAQDPCAGKLGPDQADCLRQQAQTNAMQKKVDAQAKDPKAVEAQKKLQGMMKKLR